MINRNQFSVLIGNLTSLVTEDDLEAVIKLNFDVLRVSVVKYVGSAKSKRFAFCDCS